MKTLITLATLLAVGALTGCAGQAQQAASSVPGIDAAASAGSGQCFRRSEIRNHTVGDPRTLYFDIGGHDVYRIEMSNACLASAVSSDPIILRNDSGQQQVCRPIDLDITIDAAGPSKCIVSHIVRMTPAEVAALPKKMRP